MRNNVEGVAAPSPNSEVNRILMPMYECLPQRELLQQLVGGEILVKQEPESETDHGNVVSKHDKQAR